MWWTVPAEAGVTAWQERQYARAMHAAGLEAHTITADDGSTVAYWSGGTGSPVVLVHGFGGSALFTWIKQRHLAKTHRLIVPDLLWFGHSQGNGSADLDRQVSAVRAVVAAEGVARADWVGVSYGGFVSLKVATEHPDEVQRLVIVDSPGPVWTRADHVAMLDRLGLDDPAELFVPATPDGVRALIRLAYHHPPVVPRFALVDAWNELYSSYASERRALLDDLSRRWDDDPAWTVTAPTLVIWGEHDPLFPLEAGERLTARLGGRMVVIRGAAHAPNVERGRRFNREVTRFLQNTSP
jgi:pimeloyl-ACP methyl ester carboxylesterase